MRGRLHDSLFFTLKRNILKFVAALIPALAFATASCRSVSGPSNVGSDRLNKAETALARGDYGSVISMLDGRVDGSIRGSKLLGRALLATGSPTRARLAFVRATTLDGNDAEAWMLLADSSERDRFFEHAIEAYERVLKIQPENALAAKRESLLLANLHLYSQAVTALYRAAKLAPSDEEIRYKLGVVELAREHDAEAVEAFSFVINKSAAHSAALHGRGVASARLARQQSNPAKRGELIQSAEADLEQAVKLAADDAEGFYNLGWLREELKNDPAGAEAAYRNAIQRQPRHVASLVRLGGIIASRGDKAAASEYYKTAMEASADPRVTSDIKNKIAQLAK